MKTNFYPEPRKFYIKNGEVTISDLGKINLDTDELVSFQTQSGKECDFMAKEWGFYPTSSLNVRMKQEGFKIALVRNHDNKVQINVVEHEKIKEFYAYLQSHNNPPRVICWLDECGSAECDAIEKCMKLNH